jgi:hypothetical protein
MYSTSAGAAYADKKDGRAFGVYARYAASTDIGDDLSMRFEWPVSEVHPTL